MSKKNTLKAIFVAFCAILFGASSFAQGGKRVQHLHQLDCADGEVPQYSDQAWTCGSPDAGATSDTFPESNLLTSSDQLMISEWTGHSKQIWRRCFSVSEHGASSQIFHSQCGFRGPTVSVIQFDNGLVVGGYSEVSQSSDTVNMGYVTATSAFLFSVTNQKRYLISDPSQATFNHPNYGPTFGGGHDIYVASDMATGYCRFPYSYSWQGQSRNTNLSGATQELCGTDPGLTTAMIEIEVFVFQDQ